MACLRPSTKHLTNAMYSVATVGKHTVSLPLTLKRAE